MGEVYAPVPKQKGRYNMYDTPDGGVHIAYSVENELGEQGEVQHIEIPGKILKMAAMLESGSISPMKAFSSLRHMAGGS
jgi:hypothetical protein